MFNSWLSRVTLKLTLLKIKSMTQLQIQIKEDQVKDRNSNFKSICFRIEEFEHDRNSNFKFILFQDRRIWAYFSCLFILQTRNLCSKLLSFSGAPHENSYEPLIIHTANYIIYFLRQFYTCLLLTTNRQDMTSSPSTRMRSILTTNLVFVLRSRYSFLCSESCRSSRPSSRAWCFPSALYNAVFIITSN